MHSILKEFRNSGLFRLKNGATIRHQLDFMALPNLKMAAPMKTKSGPIAQL